MGREARRIGETGATLARLAHGGDLGEFKRAFPLAREPIIDLSTGINPVPYPVGSLPASTHTRLPSPDDLVDLERLAARAYASPLAAQVIAGAGTQAFIQALPRLLAVSDVAVLGPTYEEHARGWAAAGHRVRTVADLDGLHGADVAIVVNSNNPTGRLLSRGDLAALLSNARAPGLLVVDEAFADLVDGAASCIDLTAAGRVVVLRSFGKTFGLAGVRLGFAIAGGTLAARLRDAVGPWPVAGVALALGRAAVADAAWLAAARERLMRDGAELERLLVGAGFAVVGGTPLFRLMAHPQAEQAFVRLGNAGICVRRFAAQPTWLRFGMPPPGAAWSRLASALGAA